MKPICFARKQHPFDTCHALIASRFMKMPKSQAFLLMIFHISSKGIFPPKLGKEHTAQKWPKILVVGFIVIILPPSLSSCEIDEGWDTSKVQPAPLASMKNHMNQTMSNQYSPSPFLEHILTKAVFNTKNYLESHHGILQHHVLLEIGETISPIEASAKWNATHGCVETQSATFLKIKLHTLPTTLLTSSVSFSFVCVFHVPSNSFSLCRNILKVEHINVILGSKFYNTVTKKPQGIRKTKTATSMHSSNKLANQATSSQTRQRPPFPPWQSCAWASKSVFPASSQRTPWETQHTDRETNSKAKIKSADETPSMTWKHGPSDMLPHMWRKATNIAMVSHRASCEKHFLCGSTSWTSSVTCFGGAKDSVCCPFTCLFLSFMSRRPETNWLNWLRVLYDDVVQSVRKNTYSTITACMTCM